MRLPYRVAGLLLFAVVLLLWAGGDSIRRAVLPSPTDQAAAGAADRAERIARWLGSPPEPTNDARALARAVLAEPQWAGTEVLSATGDRRNYDAELLLRITVDDTFTNEVGLSSQATVTRCYLLDQSDPSRGFTVHERDCPPGHSGWSATAHRPGSAASGRERYCDRA